MLTRKLSRPVQPVRPEAKSSVSADSVPEERAQRLVVRGLDKRFVRRGGGEVVAINNTSLALSANEILVLLGPSGCGKTTLLRSIAGLETPDRGEILLDGRRLYSSEASVDLPPERRQMSMLFQSYALWPHLTVKDNVAYPLKTKGVKRSQIQERVRGALTTVQCAHLADQYPGSISGGQQQRIALARALVADNPVVLFDEPLSNVDAQVRAQLRRELREIQRSIGFAALYVTHDQEEAMSLADRIAVLHEGSIVQIGPPAEIYERPATRFVARFMGSLNEVPAEVERSDGEYVHLRSAIGPIIAHDHNAGRWRPGDRVAAAWRPEFLRVSDTAPGGDNAWSGRLLDTAFLGARTEFSVRVADSTLIALAAPGAELPHGGGDDVAVYASIARNKVMVFPDDDASQRRVDGALDERTDAVRAGA